MVEVFKTDVKDRDHANVLIDQLQKAFLGYRASFDLDDCDHILRVECAGGRPVVPSIVDLLAGFGYQAEVLPDDEYAANPTATANP